MVNIHPVGIVVLIVGVALCFVALKRVVNWLSK